MQRNEISKKKLKTCATTHTSTDACDHHSTSARGRHPRLALSQAKLTTIWLRERKSSREPAPQWKLMLVNSAYASK